MTQNLMALPGYSTSRWEAGKAPTFTQMGSEGAEVPTQSAYNWGAINGADLPLINWNGGDPYEKVPPDSDLEAGHSYAGNGALTQAFQKYLADSKLKLMTGQGESGYASQLMGPDGQPIGVGSKYGGGSEGDPFAIMLAAAAALSGAEVAGVGGAGGSGAVDAYLTNGASDMSTLGGQGGYAGAVGANAAPESLATTGGSSTMYDLNNALKSAKPWLQAGKAIAPLLGGLRHASPSTPAGNSPQSTAGTPAAMGGVGQYDAKAWDPSTIDMHGRTPSLSVNLNDPSAALFGYGEQPVYYKPAPMAEGGLVDDGSDQFWDFGPSTQTPDQPPDTGLANYQLARGEGIRPSGDTSQRIFGPDNAVPSPSATSPLDWIQKVLSGNKDALKQGAMGVGALGLLQSLLAGSTPRNYKTPQQLQGSVVGTQNATNPALAAMMNHYFQAPPSVYVPPHSPFKPGGHAEGGVVDYASGGAYNPMAHGSLVPGQGGGQQDNVPANLSPGEYVFDADTVSALGDGSTEEGARRLDEMREQLREHKRSAPAHSIPPKAQHPLAYLRKK